MIKRYIRRGIIADINGEVIDVQTKGSAQTLRNVPLLGNPASLSIGDAVMLQEFRGRLVAMATSNTPGDGVYSPVTKTVASGGEIAVHAIDGPYHSGHLAHSALSGVSANQHHNQVTIGAGGLSGKLSLSTQELTLAAIDHADLSNISADQHVAHSGVSISTSGLGLSGGGSIDTSRTITLSSSSDPGAAAAILASTSAGGLTLQSLALNGSLDITDGDLTVLDGAATVFFVDESAHNVGVMTNAPDPQFALDVNGPVRGQYLIGPHALQLSDAVMICHFDGSYPFETNCDVDTGGHLGQVATVSGGVIGRPGKFGKAVQIAESATNLVTNPSFETDLNGWEFGNSSGGSRARRETDAPYGEYCLEVQTGGAGYCYNTTSEITVSPGAAYTVSAFMKQASGSGYATLRIWQYDSAHVYIPAGNKTVTFTSGPHDWERKNISFTTEADAAYVRIVLEQGDYSDDALCYWDAVQLEPGCLTPYLDGSLGDGHSWDSTPHASASSRTASTVYWSNPLDDNAGTLTLYWQPATDYDSQPTGYLFDEGNLAAYYDSSDYKIKFTDGTNTAQSAALDFDALDWLHLVFVWSSAGLAIYVDGVANGSNGTYTAPTLGASLYLGSTTAGASQPNALFDELFILDRALSAVGARSIYESNAPVFAETSIRAWRSPGQVPIRVNEEGLWGRDEDGNASLGWSSVDGKSWGGQTLGKGDFLLGHGTEYMLWDASAATLNITGGITAKRGELQSLNVSGLLDMVSGGKIRVGTGTKDVDLTGWLIDDAEIVGQNGAGTDEVCLTSEGKVTAGDGVEISGSGINIYGTDNALTTRATKTGTIQCSVNSAGAITAGADAVTLDANGIEIKMPSVHLTKGAYSFGSTISHLDKVGVFASEGTGHAGVLLSCGGVTTLPACETNAVVAAQSAATYLAHATILASSGTKGAYLELRADSDAASYSYIVADAEYLKLGTTTTMDLRYNGDLRPVRGGSTKTGYIYVPLTEVVVWNGVSKAVGTYGLTASDLGIPTEAKAVSISLIARFALSGSAYYAYARKYGVDESVVVVHSQRANTYIDACGVVNCDSSGRIQVVVGGATSNSTYLRVHGYYI